MPLSLVRAPLRAVCLCLVIGLAACGQKGPLYSPAEPAAQDPAGEAESQDRAD